MLTQALQAHQTQLEVDGLTELRGAAEISIFGGRPTLISADAAAPRADIQVSMMDDPGDEGWQGLFHEAAAHHQISTPSNRTDATGDDKWTLFSQSIVS